MVAMRERRVELKTKKSTPETVLQQVIHVLRQVAHRRIEQASIKELLMRFPLQVGDEIFHLPPGRTAPPHRIASNPPHGIKRKKRRDLTPAERTEIRNRLRGVRRSSSAYRRIRDELAKKLGASRRQIYGSWRGWRSLKRSKRKKAKR